MLLLRPPGVYRPQGDTRLLRDAFELARLPRGGAVLDIGTGTGTLAITAARAGAREVTAVDVARRAVLTTKLNALLNRVRVRVRRGDALDLVAGHQFDIVLANPPYVPCLDLTPDTTGSGRAWDAGYDGRAVLDRLCAAAPELLAPGGTMLIVHSGLCDADLTLAALREGGLKAAVVDRRTQPFGPVMRTRRQQFVDAGLIGPHDHHEELVVVRADRVVPSSP